LLALDPDRRPTLIDLNTGEVIRRYEASPVLAQQFTPDGRRIILTLLYRIQVHDVESGRVCREIEDVRATVDPGTISSDGRRLVARERGPDAELRVHCISTGAVLARLPTSKPTVSRSQVSPDGRFVLEVTRGGTARIRHLGRDPLGLPGTGGRLFRRVGREGRRLVSTTSGGWNPPYVWDLEACKPTVCLGGHWGRSRSPSTTAAVDATQDGRKIVTAGYRGDIIISDSATGRQIRGWQGHKGMVWSAVFSADGARILTAAQDGTARVWDASTGRQLLVLGTEKPWPSDDRRVVAFGSRWASFCRDGRRIVTRIRDIPGARVWSAEDGRLLHRLETGAHLAGAGFTVDGKAVVTSARKPTGPETRIWDVETGECRLTLGGLAWIQGEPSSSLSPDGRHVVLCAGREGFRIHSLESGALVRELIGDFGIHARARYSPDGRYVVATGSLEGGVVVWETTSGTPVLETRLGGGTGRAPVFTADSRHIALQPRSGLRLVPLDPLAVARTRRPRAFTERERERYGIPVAETSDESLGPVPSEHPWQGEDRAVEDLRRETAGLFPSGEDEDDAEREVRLMVRRLGLPDPALVLTLLRIARKHLDAGEAELAEGLLRAAHLHGRRTLGPENASVEQVSFHFAEVLARNGRAGEAEPLLRGLLERWSRIFGDAPRTLEAASLLGEVLTDLRKWEEAESRLLFAWEGREATAFISSVPAETTRERLLRLYEAWGKPEKAAEWGKKADPER
jgi:WD40 repeat protein